ncbi:hypothetical protein GGD40_005582 [Paraburkholderia bryophila]|uniref:TniQ protein n=2 Tax=Paraburkholderia bryophila TaxID=420952 RepID=A0A7Y9WTW6_9BURK|nr:hypothetical protein [Paraburkholderia bryophila]
MSVRPGKTKHPAFEEFARLRTATLIAGETVPSFLRRAAVDAGYRTEFWSHQAQMGRQGRPLEAMPSPLIKLSEVLRSTGATPDALLQQGHTLYGYWTCCAKAATRRRVRSRLIYGHPGPIRPCRLPINLEPSPYEVLHCPACDEMHLTLMGCTPALVVHHAPFISVCPEHGCLLNESSNRALFRQKCIYAAAAGSHRKTAEFALRTRRLVESSSSDDLVHDFRALMLERGFVTERGRVRWQEFMKAHHSFQTESFLDTRLDTVCHDEELLRRTMNCLMNDAGCAHPVLYCLLNWSLNGVACSSRNTEAATAKGRKPIPEAFMRHCHEASASATAAARLVGVSVNTFITRAQELGLTVRLKPSLLTESVRAEIETLYRSGKSVGAIATALGMSASSIYRTLRVTGLSKSTAEMRKAENIANVRKSLAAAVSECGPLTVSELRRQNPALYARAYRADRNFIRQYTSEGSRVATKKAISPRPRMMESEAQAAIRELSTKTESRHSPRLSARRIVTETGLSDFYLNVCGPETKALLDVVVETELQFVRRRVAEATAELMETEGNCAPWKALHRAGLRITRSRLDQS